jgi:hypothetical protein
MLQETKCIRDAAYAVEVGVDFMAAEHLNLGSYGRISQQGVELVEMRSV